MSCIQVAGVGDVVQTWLSPEIPPLVVVGLSCDLSGVCSIHWTTQEKLLRHCYEGKLDAVKAALAQGASVNDDASTCTDGGKRSRPLVAAIEREHTAILHHLLSLGAQASFADPAIMLAAVKAPLHILDSVITAGGDVNKTSRAHAWKSPLFELLENGSKPQAKEKLQRLLVEPVLDLGKVTNAYFDATPAQHAILYRHSDFAAMIEDEV